MARTNLGKIVMIPKGTYSTTVTYSKLDVVTSNGSGYISKSDNNLNKPLTNETYWMKLVEKGDKGDKGDSYIITEADIQEIEDYVVDKTSGQIIATRNELERVKNDVLETGTDTDTYIHLEDSAMAEYQELSVDGVCEQETTTGVNLYETIINTNQGGLNGLKVTQNNDGSVNVQGTATATWSNITTNTPIKIEPNVDYCFSINKATNYRVTLKIALEDGSQNNVFIYSGETYKKFQVTQNVKDVYAYIYDANNFSNINETFYFQVEKGSTPTKYEKFTGGQPSPSPDYPQEIKVQTGNINLTSCNKNLFDNDTEIMNGININQALAILAAIPTSTSIYVPCKPNTAYTIQKVITSRFVVGTCSEKPQEGTVLDNIINVSKLGSTTITTNEKAHFIVVWLHTTTYDTIALEDVLSSVQVEEGSTATSYVDHLYSQITAKLPEGEFIGKFSDTNKDYVSLEYNKEDGQYHTVVNKKIKKRILTANDNFRSYSSTIPCFGTENFTDKASGKSNFMCNSFSYLGDAQFQNLGYAMSFNIGNYSNYMYIQVPSTIAAPDELSKFVAFIGTLPPIEIYYEVATPYKIDLGPVDMPLSYNEITNIFTDSDLLPKINAKYYRNFITTVQNLQVNEKALKQELVDINARLSALESANTSITTESEVTE